MLSPFTSADLATTKGEVEALALHGQAYLPLAELEYGKVELGAMPRTH